MRAITIACLGTALAILPLFSGAAFAADQPQWGEAWSRNMVSAEAGLAEWFEPGSRDTESRNIDPATTKNVKWVVKLGDVTYGTPVVAGGRVYVGTNNDAPRDERITGDRGVLMCLDQRTGDFLWQLNVPKLTSIKWADWHHVGITSSPTVEGDRVYLTSNRGEVMCLDADGMADGNDGPFTGEGQLTAGEGAPPLEPGEKDADVIWSFDMPAELDVTPHNASNCSVLVDGDLLYVCTANGVDWTHMFVKYPESPSVVALDKHTGRLVARDGFKIGPDITHGQWSSLASGRVGDRRLGFFGSGSGVLYAFEMLESGAAGGDPAVLAPAWQFHGHPLAQTQDEVPADHQHNSTSYEVTAMPVFYKGRVYVTFTQEPFHGMKLGWLVCLDAGGSGDVTRSAIRWSYDDLGASASTVAIHDGLVYAAGFWGKLHCLDAETGELRWVHNAGGRISASPLVADGKVYLPTDGNVLWVLRAGPELEVVSRIRMRDRISATPIAADGLLYVATWKHLYAVQGDEPAPGE